MKKLISIFAIMIGSICLIQAQSNNNAVENPDNYKAQNNRLTPGVDEPVFDGSKLESNQEMADASYKNQFSKSKNKGNGNLFLMPVDDNSGDTGFYASGYSKSGFQATRRKSNPLNMTTSPGTAQE